MTPLIHWIQLLFLLLKGFLLGRFLFAVVKLILWVMGREPNQVWQHLYVHVVVRAQYQFWRLHWKVRRGWRSVVGVVREVRERLRGNEPLDPSVWALDFISIPLPPSCPTIVDNALYLHQPGDCTPEFFPEFQRPGDLHDHDELASWILQQHLDKRDRAITEVGRKTKGMMKSQSRPRINKKQANMGR
ncbi:hypothetical protein DL98DRAFT_533147 [Cadophora sp. DSE1049]|nr:hypothetical protein DL98DRAFT_533147 [Cadophora sp. DSE1049]